MKIQKLSNTMQKIVEIFKHIDVSAVLSTCCAYSCTQYSLHTQYVLLTHADVLLCLQLHTVQSPHTQYMLLTHADALLCLQLHTVQSPYTVHASNPC